VTGVDLSVGMLERAREANPDVEYFCDDMRSVRLGRQFDVVAIPDSIDYMVTLDDLRQAIETAVAHLKTGGTLLIVANVEERFHNNNFAFTAEKEGVHVTLFENDYASRQRPNTYEATLFYLIRRNNQLSIRTEQHVLGLFPERTWQQVFNDAQVAIQETALSHAYDKYVLNDGAHQPTVFLGRKM
jgi:SAM-dependent methyltransferase